ncbi:hypothetical protein PZS63_00745 [Klebsiella aerogenes]|uniref:hypothetical protein n=1 Tax=Klebsiella aerogenes TaxID=548 RepID=UPI002B27A65F|nr:hypothetical protein [Klebsiella aerogenes]MEA8782155.1 hypothetical protein [Klebsiella aerogenes]
MDAIYVPRDLHEYKQHLKPNDVFIYSFILSAAELEYNSPALMHRAEFSKWLKISPSAFYNSVQRLINTGLITKIAPNIYTAKDYKEV